jgi:hypothetical protein
MGWEVIRSLLGRVLPRDAPQDNGKVVLRTPQAYPVQSTVRLCRGCGHVMSVRTVCTHCEVAREVSLEQPVAEAAIDEVCGTLSD